MENEKQEYSNLALSSSVWNLFVSSSSYRNRKGYTDTLQRSCLIKDKLDIDESIEVEDEGYEDSAAQCDCIKDHNESCPLCEKPELKSIDEVEEFINSHDYLDDIGSLLANTKRYEFIALSTNSYSAVGNKPFMLKTSKGIPVDEGKIKEAAQAFYEYINDFLNTNEVLVTEIADAFEVSALRDLADKLSASIEKDLLDDLDKSMTDAENIIKEIFNRVGLMKEYMEVLRDITQYPIGILWATESAIKKTPTIKNGKLGCSANFSADVQRVDPRYCWFTSDWRQGKQGRAVFRKESLNYDDLDSLLSSANDQCIKDNIHEVMEKEPLRMPMLSLFEDEIHAEKTEYDVLIARGRFKASELEEAGMKRIKSCSNNGKYVLAEVWMTGNKIIYVNEIHEAIGIGVYTTTFRRWDDSLYGLSLNDLLSPFVKFYQTVISGISKSSGKNVGSIVMIDTAVIEDPYKYITKDENGIPTIDLQGDTIIEFDSSRTDLSPTSKGVPIIIDKFPSDLPQLLPLVSLVERQLEKLTGIPAFLTQGSNMSSALRTEKMLNTVQESNSTIIKSMLKEHEDNILRKVIEYFYYSKIDDGVFSELFLKANPIILLNSEITQEFNSDRRAVSNFNELSPYLRELSPEKFASAVNGLAREAYGYEDDVIESSNPFTSSKSNVVAPSPVTGGEGA